MSFTCITHGWRSDQTACPSCQQVTATTFSAVASNGPTEKLIPDSEVKTVALFAQKVADLFEHDVVVHVPIQPGVIQQFVTTTRAPGHQVDCRKCAILALVPDPSALAALSVEHVINNVLGQTDLPCQCSDCVKLRIALAAHDAALRTEWDKETADLQQRIDTLDEWRKESKHWCGCELDEHGSYCMAHAPKIQKLEADNSKLRLELNKTLQPVCKETGEPSKDGVCVIHGGDSCLIIQEWHRVRADNAKLREALRKAPTPLTASSLNRPDVLDPSTISQSIFRLVGISKPQARRAARDSGQASR